MLGAIDSLWHLLPESDRQLHTFTWALDPETKLRTIGFQEQMKSFTFHFSFYLSKNSFGMTDNLSGTLQKEKMTAVSGINLWEKNDDFLFFFETLNKMASKSNQIED